MGVNLSTQAHSQRSRDGDEDVNQSE